MADADELDKKINQAESEESAASDKKAKLEQAKEEAKRSDSTEAEAESDQASGLFG